MGEIMKRTHMCGVLTEENIGAEVCLNGWVAKQRSLGSIIFCDLTACTGISLYGFCPFPRFFHT